MNSTGLSIPAVEPFRQGNDFGRWLRGVERYLCAVGIQEADRKCAVLLHLVGPDVADLSETLPEETSETADSFERLKRKLTTYLSPVRNAVAERSLFHGMQMEPEEDLERFLGRLRAQVVRCGYAATEVDRELRDRCVLGSRADLRAKLVKLAASKGDGLTLAEVRQTARAHRDMEQLGAQLGGTRLAEAPAADAEGAVNAVRSPQSRLGTCFRCGAAGHWQRDCPAAGAVPRARDSRCPAGQAASGGRSGATGEHGRGAPGNSGSDGGPRQRRCFKCGSTGHLKAACPQRRLRLVAAEDEQTDGDGDAWLVSSVDGDAWLVNSVEASAAEPEMKTVTVNGQQLAMVVDTGSPVSLVSAETARQRGLLQLLDPCDLRLTSFTAASGQTTEETELSSRQTAAETVEPTEETEETGRRTTEEPVPSCQQTEAEVSRQTTEESDGPSGRTAVEASRRLTDDGGAGAIGPTVDGRGELAGGGGAGTGEPAGGGGANAGGPDFNGLASEAEAGPTGRAGSPRRRAQPGTPRRSTRRGGARSRKCLCGSV
ncbi:DNA-binding protein HEXBP [Amphibalanus amphitrite]|uniref:DNA-binding protein HEXBP n=1 Tax=Amphibalanus amphitrite TaxID=1232801 RepID=A0A6A4XAN8_AMPAM|nr:DNA-binding protein HEXBP [Amphibalanus amphitrite]